jgi:hypothetical protein
VIFSVRFGFYKKIIKLATKTGFAWFFLVWLGFFGFGSVFSCLARFFPGFFGLGLVWFFRFQAYKIKMAGFFKF